MAELESEEITKMVGTIRAKSAHGEKLTSEEKILHDLGSEVLRWRALYLDQPEDRLWHDKDGTWWKRDDTRHTGIGSLVSAEPPAYVEQMREALQDLEHNLEDSLNTVKVALYPEEELDEEEEEDEEDEEDESDLEDEEDEEEGDEDDP